MPVPARRPPVRIGAVRVYRCELPVVGGSFRTSRVQVSRLDSTLVEVVTDDGVSGFGEVCPLGPTYQPQHAPGVRAALATIAPHLLGCDAVGVERMRAVMDDALAGHVDAKAAIDIALWDVVGRCLGLRVADLLGGAWTEEVPSYVSVPVCPPDEVARVVTQTCAAGYRRIQVKVGGRPLADDLEAVRAACTAVAPGVRVVVDPNRGWSTSDAVTASQACRDLPFVLEQPCDTLAEHESLAGRLCHPLYLDEGTVDVDTVMRVVDRGIADGLSMKVTRVGGLSAMRTVRDLCGLRNVPMSADDSWGGDVIAAACVHLGATVHPRRFEGTWIAAPYVAGHLDPDHPVEVRDGRIRLPDGPGLGVTPRRDLLGDPVLEVV